MMNQPSDVPSIMPVSSPPIRPPVSRILLVLLLVLVCSSLDWLASLPPVSLTDTAHSLEPDSDVEYYSEPTTPIPPMEDFDQ